ncbi:MAG: hypothetical protein A2057_13550 [Ignavibacteria bacterium GWA2_35_9]|nr:MAG: hypothetical protein A2057_13550 [Ignavibacteria bacterium GWA2_35_9]OGU48250.1 MAG: hypothetical protein A2000_04275 [Ignavibacteria bacterium GWB2_36_8]OGU50835.1 MAG: hypothetical protein A2080_02740 [Ignavibacteria bacterium GWC2_36_12]OGV09379.1 MAG: hypothetical protein A2330_00525 [Ignavibacteria bacterium RIFOXYB2_FULL_36_7]
MLKLYRIKILNLLCYQALQLINLFLNRKKIEYQHNKLLIIRLDSIGDYMLFRNFIGEIKKSKKYRDYTVTLCGNILWKDIAESFDKEVVNDFIWIDRRKFYGNIFYKYKIMRSIREKGFEIVIDPTFSREILYGDSIVKVSGAKEKIGSTGSPDSHSKWKRNLLTDKYYTKLISSSKANLFEFNRNKEFFERVLNEKIEIEKPFIDSSKIFSDKIPVSEYYIVIFPGAKHLKRRWSVDSFAEVSGFILNEYNLGIVIAGSEEDYQLAEQIIFKTRANKCLNMTGKTKLNELAKLISNATLLISNDTGAVHIAAAVNSSFICISNGNHFGRFHPYPKEIFDKAYYIYPPEIMNNQDNIELLKNKYRFSSELDINEIKPGTVKETIKKILG